MAAQAGLVSCSFSGGLQLLSTFRIEARCTVQPDGTGKSGRGAVIPCEAAPLVSAPAPPLILKALPALYGAGTSHRAAPHTFPRMMTATTLSTSPVAASGAQRRRPAQRALCVRVSAKASAAALADSTLQSDHWSGGSPLILPNGTVSSLGIVEPASVALQPCTRSRLCVLCHLGGLPCPLSTRPCVGCPGVAGHPLGHPGAAGGGLQPAADV